MGIFLQVPSAAVSRPIDIMVFSLKTILLLSLAIGVCQAWNFRRLFGGRVQQGSFNYLTGYAGPGYGTDVVGRGQLIRYRDGTSLSVAISGLPVNTQFNGHLHRTSCADQGGAHYQDIAQCPLNTDGSNSCDAVFPGDDTTPGNEIWCNGVTTDKGRLVVQNSVEWAIPSRCTQNKDARQ